MGARGTPARFVIQGAVTLDFTLGRHASETAERMVLRAIARALFPDPDLVPGGELCRGDEPAWRAPADGSMVAGRDRLHLVVGNAAPREGRAGRRSRGRVERTVRVRAGNPRSQAARPGAGSGTRPPGPEEIVLEAGFVAALAARLGRRNVWEVEREPASLVVRVGGEALSGRLAYVD